MCRFKKKINECYREFDPKVDSKMKKALNLITNSENRFFMEQNEIAGLQSEFLGNYIELGQH